MKTKPVVMTFNVGERVSFLNYEVFEREDGSTAVSEQRKRMSGTIESVQILNHPHHTVVYKIKLDPGQSLCAYALTVTEKREKMMRIS